MEEFLFLRKKYACDILKKFKMNTTKPIMALVEKRLKLTKDDIRELVDSTNFRRLVGSLRYLTSPTPDITYSVQLISRYMESPRQSQL